MTAALIPSPAALTATPVPGARPRDSAMPVTAEVYRRRRLVVAAVVVGLVLGIASFGRQADAARTAEAEAAQAVLVVVQPGDTLWAIAEALAPGADPRPLVAALGRIAGTDTLIPGQLLTIPGDFLD